MKVTLDLPGYVVVCSDCFKAMIEDLQQGIQRKGTVYNEQTHHVGYEIEAQGRQGPEGDQAWIQGSQPPSDQAGDVDPGPRTPTAAPPVREECDHEAGRCRFEQFGYFTGDRRTTSPQENP